VPHSELAAEKKMSEAASRKWMQRVREKALGAMHKRGYQVAGFAALVAAAFGIYFVASREPKDKHVAHGRLDEGLRERAAELRHQAADACRARHWDDCEKALDRAAPLDTAGERAPEVEELRAAIAASRSAMGPGDAGAGEKGAPDRR
jgi:hypothetical protein